MVGEATEYRSADVRDDRAGIEPGVERRKESLLPLIFCVISRTSSRLFRTRSGRYDSRSYAEVTATRRPAAEDPPFRKDRPAPSARGPAPRHTGLHARGLRRLDRYGDAGTDFQGS